MHPRGLTNSSRASLFSFSNYILIFCNLHYSQAHFAKQSSPLLSFAPKTLLVPRPEEQGSPLFTLFSHHTNCTFNDSRMIAVSFAITNLYSWTTTPRNLSKKCTTKSKKWTTKPTNLLIEMMNLSFWLNLPFKYKAQSW